MQTGDHAEALRVLVDELVDVPSAIDYCRTFDGAALHTTLCQHAIDAHRLVPAVGINVCTTVVEKIEIRTPYLKVTYNGIHLVYEVSIILMVTSYINNILELFTKVLHMSSKQLHSICSYWHKVTRYNKVICIPWETINEVYTFIVIKLKVSI